MTQEGHTSPRQRTESLKRAARDLGFDACGVAPAGPVDPEDRLGQWIANGYHADMAWMASSKTLRQDIRKKLPSAKSVVVVARNYYAPRPEAPPGTGRVSRYAWGRDYHRVLRRPLKRLAAHIASMDPDAECYCSVDSGPVLEKFWAARAGIGWIGKHSLVLNDTLGSWLFLGVIATSMDLESDTPMPDACGDCTACIDACPTHAIVAPRTVDARRCISYQTVENKGETPPDLVPYMGAWVFGCDICQEACPWNRDAGTTDETDLHARPGHANPDLDELLDMDEERFRERFRGSVIMRARNAKPDPISLDTNLG